MVTKVKTRLKTKENKASQQHNRFVEAAKQLGCDENGESFEKALKRLAPKPAKKS